MRAVSGAVARERYETEGRGVWMATMNHKAIKPSIGCNDHQASGLFRAVHRQQWHLEKNANPNHGLST